MPRTERPPLYKGLNHQAPSTHDSDAPPIQSLRSSVMTPFRSLHLKRPKTTYPCGTILVNESTRFSNLFSTRSFTLNHRGLAPSPFTCLDSFTLLLLHAPHSLCYVQHELLHQNTTAPHFFLCGHDQRTPLHLSSETRTN